MGNILVVIIVIIFMSYIVSISNKQAERMENGDFILKMGKIYSIIGWILIIISIIVLFLPKDDKDFYSILVIFLILFTSGVIFILISKTNILVTNYQIIYFGLFNKITIINWEDINSIEFGEFSKELIIKSNMREIKVSPLYIGINDFKNCIIEKLDKELYEEAFENFSKYIGK